MSTVRLFSEAVDHDVEYITEAKEDGGKYFKMKYLNITRILLKKIVHMVNLDILRAQRSIWNVYPT
jgi:hypothetical protein